MLDAARVLDRLIDLGIGTRVDGGRLFLTPMDQVPAGLLAEVRENKPAIVALLTPVGDGRPPPMDRPPQSEQELRRLIDHLVDPVAFSRWLEKLMQQTDPAEMEGEGASIHFS